MLKQPLDMYKRVTDKQNNNDKLIEISQEELSANPNPFFSENGLDFIDYLREKMMLTYHRHRLYFYFCLIPNLITGAHQGKKT